MLKMLKENELETLKEHAKLLTLEIERTRKRIEEVESTKKEARGIIVKNGLCLGCGICV
jgi:coenzyme F420-reducing hydrogenase gamma subunit